MSPETEDFSWILLPGSPQVIFGLEISMGTHEVFCKAWCNYVVLPR